MRSIEHAVWAVQVTVAVGSVHLSMVWELDYASCAEVLDDTIYRDASGGRMTALSKLL
jgi:hypothetical protein